MRLSSLVHCDHLHSKWELLALENSLENVSAMLSPRFAETEAHSYDFLILAKYLQQVAAADTKFRFCMWVRTVPCKIHSILIPPSAGDQESIISLSILLMLPRFFKLRFGVPEQPNLHEDSSLQSNTTITNLPKYGTHIKSKLDTRTRSSKAFSSLLSWSMFWNYTSIDFRSICSQNESFLAFVHFQGEMIWRKNWICPITH